MSYKIEPHGLANAAASGSVARRPALQEASQTPAPRVADAVRLSGDASLATAVLGAMPSAQADSAARVAATRQAIASGNYTVDTAQIAARMLRFEWMLANR